MRILFTFILACVFSLGVIAQDHFVTANPNNSFLPADITIQAGETVQWDNNGGFHNVNGSLATFPNNPEGFSNGGASAAAWTFQHTFLQPGSYAYHCDPHSGFGMTGSITVLAVPALIITGVFDAQPIGAGAKGVELKALADIPDLSLYGIGSANNGGGTDSIEFSFDGISLDEGECIYVAGDADLFAEFFGGAPDYESSNAMSINGDDAIELFYNGEAYDVFGNITHGGTINWRYADGWAYRKAGAGINNGAFNENNWDFSPVNGLSGVPNNNAADMPFPVCKYLPTAPTGVFANIDLVFTLVDESIDVKVLANDYVGSGITSLNVLETSSEGNAVANGLDAVTFTPNGSVCDEIAFVSYEICDASSCDTSLILIDIFCVSEYLESDIATITADADGDFYADSIMGGGRYIVDGIVYGPNYRPSAAGLQFTIIDETNEGLALISFTEDFGYTVAEGDEVKVWGVLEEFNGLTQIMLDSVEFLSGGNMIESPQTVDSLSEDTESELVQFERATILSGVQAGGGFNYRVALSNGREETVRFDDDLSLTSLVIGSIYRFTGIGGQFDGNDPKDAGYQLLPRSDTDIELIVNTINPALGDKIVLSPNPVLNQLNIQTDVQIENVRVFNTLGQQVIFQQANLERIQVGELPNGVYHIQALTSEGLWIDSFVKQ